MAHTAPDITVEIGLATAPMASSTTWTDVTAYVDQHHYPITIDRGRGDAQSAAGAGSCSFTLINDDKRFTPGYTGGAYGSNVKIGKRVRITETHNGTNYRRFTGYISSFDMGWPGGVTEQNRVTVTATDIIGLMEQFKMRNLYDHVMLNSGPIALWPLDDHGASGGAQELTGYRQPQLRRVHRAGGGTCKFDDGKGVPVIPSGRTRTVRFKSDQDSGSWTALEGTIDLQSASSSIAFGVWVNFDGNDDTSIQTTLASIELSSTYRLAIRKTTSGYIYACILDNTTPALDAVATENRRVGPGWRYLFVTYEDTLGEVNLYLDGKLQGTAVMIVGSPPAIPATAQVTVGAGRYGGGSKMTYASSNFRMGYAAVWVDDAAAAVDPEILFDAAQVDWDGKDRTSARISDLLDWMGVPSNRQDVQRGLSTVAIGNFKGMTAAEYAGQVVAAEQGFFFQKGNGDCTFQSRSHRWDTASECTLSWHLPDETFTTDLDQYVTSVEVSHSRGSVRASDRTAAATYGPRELSIDAALADPEQAKGIADYVLKLRETMKPRMSEFTYDLLTEDTQSVRDNVLSLELGDRFTVNSLPTQAHDTSLDFWIEGIRETISTHTRTVTFITTPYKDFTGLWQLGVTALDDPAVLAY